MQTFVRVTGTWGSECHRFFDLTLLGDSNLSSQIVLLIFKWTHQAIHIVHVSQNVRPKDLC